MDHCIQVLYIFLDFYSVLENSFLSVMLSYICNIFGTTFRVYVCLALTLMCPSLQTGFIFFPQYFMVEFSEIFTTSQKNRFKLMSTDQPLYIAQSIFLKYIQKSERSLFLYRQRSCLPRSFNSQTLSDLPLSARRFRPASLGELLNLI